MTTKPRSPNYPAFGLQRAIDYARKVYATNHLHKASRDVVAKALGYGTLNGKSATAMSALKKFGLLEDDGSELRITKDALTVLVEPASSPERARVLVGMATKPDLFAELQAAYPGATPNDEILRTWLLRRGFLPSTVDLPIRAYRETMELAEAQKTLYTGDTDPKPLGKRDQQPEVGDLIQWEAGGVLRMEAPRKIRAKTEHEGAWWVFVEGSETGIPMDEAVVIERKPEPAVQKQPPVLPLPSAPAAAQVQAVEAGEQQVGSGKIGNGLSYRLLATGGNIGAKELGKIIKHLQTQKELLEDDPPDCPLA